jgi:hypothetical protein
MWFYCRLSVHCIIKPQKSQAYISTSQSGTRKLWAQLYSYVKGSCIIIPYKTRSGFMRLIRFVPFSLFVHETQRTYENYSSCASSSSVHSSYESNDIRARFIGWEEREYNQTPIIYKNCTVLPYKFSTVSTIVFHRVVEKV